LLNSCSACCLQSATASAETGVEGRYLSADVSDVRILLTIQAPPPKAFIVLHRIPPGVTMTGASPTPSGFQQDGTTVKWLFKRPPPGSITAYDAAFPAGAGEPTGRGDPLPSSRQRVSGGENYQQDRGRASG
jgi:hypothetical protein